VSVNVVAIDGPAGTGKSTVAPLVAEKLGLKYLDTGLMYRSVAYACVQANVVSGDELKVSGLLLSLSIDVLEDDSVALNGEVLKDELRTPEVSQAVSNISKNSLVRENLVSKQRAWIEKNDGGVLDGRDIGTVVSPDARLKIFLIADVDVRAQRRQADTDSSLEAIVTDIKRRDDADSNRALAPLKPADDAVSLDTTHLSITEVVDKIVNLYQHAV